MRFFKNCKQKSLAAATNSTIAVAENSGNVLAEFSTEVFFTINGKPYQGIQECSKNPNVLCERLSEINDFLSLQQNFNTKFLLKLKRTKMNSKRYRFLCTPFTVNSTIVPIDTSLNTFIRTKAQLSGTKFMCSEGGCGACIVSVKGIHPVTKQEKIWAVNSVTYSCTLKRFTQCFSIFLFF